MKIRYFDYVATNPLHPAVLDAMLPYFREQYGNPLSIYDLGLRAREAVEKARESVAALIGAKPQTIVFTSGGVEANNFALRGIAAAKQTQGKHIIVSKVEHHSILNSARSLEKNGFAVTYLPVDGMGMIDPEAVRSAITSETILISVTHASREIGTIEPLSEISRIAREKKIVFHTDAAATTGVIPFNINELGVDLLSMTAHQFSGPKGVGALYVREGTRIVPLIYGGIQEGGRRAGTENVPGIAGMGKAAELAAADPEERTGRLRLLRDRIIEGVLRIPRVRLTGHPAKRLPHHASFVVEYIEGEAMLLLLAMKGIYAASGSACSSKALKSSPVLASLGIEAGLAQGSVVFSLGRNTTEDDVDALLAEFPPIIKRLRDMSPFSKGWDQGAVANTCTSGGD